MMLGARHEAPPYSRLTRLSRTLSRFSYTLYLAHMPLLLFLASVTVHDTRWLPGRASLTVATMIFAIVLAYAWALAALTEFHTDSVRGWVERLLHMRRDNPTPHERALAS